MFWNILGTNNVTDSTGYWETQLTAFTTYEEFGISAWIPTLRSNHLAVSLEKKTKPTMENKHTKKSCKFLSWSMLDFCKSGTMQTAQKQGIATAEASYWNRIQQ